MYVVSVMQEQMMFFEAVLIHEEVRQQLAQSENVWIAPIQSL